MKQTTVKDFTDKEIVSDSMKHAVMMALNKTSLYPQESYFQVAKQFGLEVSQVITIYEESRNGN